jgi:hypothetical protein
MVGIASGLLAAKQENKSVKSTAPNTVLIEKTVNRSSSYTLGPVVRYYVVKGLHIEASYLIGKSKLKEHYESLEMIGSDLYNSLEWTRKSEAKVKGISVGLGYSIFLDQAKHLALDVGVSYQNQDISGLRYSGIAAGFGISGFIFKSKEK